MYKVGFRFLGQTEFFAERCGVKNFAMCLTGGKLTVALVTTHIPLRKVPRALKQSEIVRVGLLLAELLRRRGNNASRIAIAGLNPHAGAAGKERKSTRLNSSHTVSSYAVFCLKKST